MIGLVLGETQLGSIIIKKLRSLKKKYIIIDITKKKIFKKDKNSFSISVGQLGKAILILKKHKCKKIIFAGKVGRPNFLKTKFDLKALYYLPKVIKELKKGETFVIKEIIKIFQKEGLKIINQTFFNPELLLKKGTFTKIKPDSSSKKDMVIAKNIINDLKNYKGGQATVVRNGNVIVVEDHRGTDFMLGRANKILNRLSQINKKQGILLKFPKQNQDLRIDLPTVGINTIKKCAKIGIRGVVVKANQNIFLDRSKCINLANKNKMFICAL